MRQSPSVRRELADRIRAHAEARGYVANRLARALSASTSRAFVGCVIPYVDARLLSVLGHTEIPYVDTVPCRRAIVNTARRAAPNGLAPPGQAEGPVGPSRSSATSVPFPPTRPRSPQ
jgi:hypothetical protein